MTGDGAGIHGTCDPRFTGVREAFAANFAGGLDVGASVAVSLAGELVVDLWGGFADGDRTRPWERDTIINVFSDDQDDDGARGARARRPRPRSTSMRPVARYWPEFAANGKGDVRVRHLLSHTAGVSGWEERIDDRGPLRLGEGDASPRGAGAVVGAGHRLGLPRAHAGLPRR